jgi:hypothetical protein
VDERATAFHGSAPADHGAALLWNLHLQVRYGGYAEPSNEGKVRLLGLLEAEAERDRGAIGGVVRAVLAGDPSAARAERRATVSGLSRDQLDAFAARHYRPERGVLVVAGAFDVSQMSATIEQLFGGWRPGRARQADVAAATASAPPAVAALADREILLAQTERAHPRVITVYPAIAAGERRAAAAVLEVMVQQRLIRALRHRLAATYHVAVAVHGDALIIDAELGGPHAARAVGVVRDALSSLDDDRFRADFILARRKAVEQVLAHAGTAGSLIERAAKVTLSARGETERGSLDTAPADALAYEIARLRPADVHALIRTRGQRAHATTIIAANRTRGLELFSAVGIAAPRVMD